MLAVENAYLRHTMLSDLLTSICVSDRQGDPTHYLWVQLNRFNVINIEIANQLVFMQTRFETPHFQFHFIFNVHHHSRLKSMYGPTESKRHNRLFIDHETILVKVLVSSFVISWSDSFLSPLSSSSNTGRSHTIEGGLVIASHIYETQDLWCIWYRLQLDTR